MKKKKIVYQVYLWFATICMSVVFFYEIQNSSSSGSFLLGTFSKLKITQLAMIFISFIFLGIFSLIFQTSKKISNLLVDQHNNYLHPLIQYISISTVALCIGLITIRNPSIVILKMQSLIIYCLVVFSILFAIELNFHLSSSNPKKNFLTITYVLVLLLSCIVLSWYYIKQPNFDTFRFSTDYLTWHQGIFIFWFVFTIKFFTSLNFFRNKSLSYIFPIVCFILFISSGILWNKIEFFGSYNMVGPFKPGAEWFPHSDSTRFDEAAQSILIGEGINFHRYVDNPLMVFYMAVLHFIGGGLFTKIMSLQVWLFSIIPVLLFVVGKRISGFTCGIACALLYIFRVDNILVNTKNSGLYSPKIFLSEGLLEPILILLVLSVLIYFSKTDNNRYVYIAIMGGLFSLSSLVRANVWLILPLLFFIIFYFSKGSIKQKIYFLATLIISISIFLAPWMYRSYKTIGTPYFMLFKFQNSIIKERYGFDETKNNPTIIEEISKPGINQVEQNSTNSVINAKDPYSQDTMQFFSKYISLAEKMLENFINNITNSMKIFPNLSSQLRPFSLGIICSYIISIGIFLFGLVTLFKSKENSFLFIGIYLAYITASSAALTSGIRYSQPVEWIFLLIFSIGISNFSKFLLLSPENDIKPSEYNNSLLTNNTTISNLCVRLPYTALLMIGLISFLIISPELFSNSGNNNESKNLLIKEKFSSGNEHDGCSNKPFCNIYGSGRVIYELPLKGMKVYDHVFFEEKPYLLPDDYDILVLYVISPSGGKWLRFNMLQEEWPKESIVWKDVVYAGNENGKAIQVYKLLILDKDESSLYFSNPKKLDQ
jgi:hypothetical protein